jgi:hypothetical protein
MIQPLNLPPFSYNFKTIENKQYIFDIIRKKYILNTPEEWVRQHFIHFLIGHRNYSKNLIKIESGLKYGNRKKRTDIQLYENSGEIYTIIECKAPEIKLDQKVINQVLIYNKVLNAKILVITNGIEHIIIKVKTDGNVEYLTDFPEKE